MCLSTPTNVLSSSDALPTSPPPTPGRKLALFRESVLQDAPPMPMFFPLSQSLIHDFTPDLRNDAAVSKRPTFKSALPAASSSFTLMARPLFGTNIMPSQASVVSNSEEEECNEEEQWSKLLSFSLDDISKIPPLPFDFPAHPVTVPIAHTPQSSAKQVGGQLQGAKSENIVLKQVDNGTELRKLPSVERRGMVPNNRAYKKQNSFAARCA